jgi:hypothetical protein
MNRPQLCRRPESRHPDRSLAANSMGRNSTGQKKKIMRNANDGRRHRTSHSKMLWSSRPAVAGIGGVHSSCSDSQQGNRVGAGAGGHQPADSSGQTGQASENRGWHARQPVFHATDGPRGTESTPLAAVVLEMAMGKYAPSVTILYSYLRQKNNLIGSLIYTGEYRFTPIPIPMWVWVTHQVTCTHIN